MCGQALSGLMVIGWCDKNVRSLPAAAAAAASGWQTSFHNYSPHTRETFTPIDLTPKVRQLTQLSCSRISLNQFIVEEWKLVKCCPLPPPSLVWCTLQMLFKASHSDVVCIKQTLDKQMCSSRENVKSLLAIFICCNIKYLSVISSCTLELSEWFLMLVFSTMLNNLWYLWQSNQGSRICQKISQNSRHGNWIPEKRDTAGTRRSEEFKYSNNGERWKIDLQGKRLQRIFPSIQEMIFQGMFFLRIRFKCLYILGAKNLVGFDHHNAPQ